MKNIYAIDVKTWIQRDGTEYGITNELVAAGIPKDKIVLAFHPEDVSSTLSKIKNLVLLIRQKP